MKKIFKKINVLGLGLILVCAVVFTTQSAFTSAKLEPLEDGWYEINITDLDFPEVEANQDIISTSPQTAPDLENAEGCAQTLNSGNRCYVYLDFDGVLEEVPETVADVDGVQVSVITDARQPE